MLSRLEIENGQDFNPFEGMDKLNTEGHTPDLIGNSRRFYLRGIGEGQVMITSLIDQANKYISRGFLILPDFSTEVLKDFIGAIDPIIDTFDPNITSQPDITLTVNLSNRVIRALNVNRGRDIRDGALFFDFRDAGDDKEPSPFFSTLDLPTLSYPRYRFDW